MKGPRRSLRAQKAWRRWESAAPPQHADNAPAAVRTQHLAATCSEISVAVVVLGCTEPCWRCGVLTTSVVGVAPAGSDDPGELFLFSEDAVKELVVGLLDESAHRRFGVGAIRPRWSKTVGAAYISNGCRACDALQGDNFLFESVAAVGCEGLAKLVRVAAGQLPAASWIELVESCVGG